MVVDQPDDERDRLVELLREITTTRRRATVVEAEGIRRFFALRVLPGRPTRRVYEKHGKHVEDDRQWPDDTSPEEYLESLRETILSPRNGLYFAEEETERTWTIYFVGRVSYRDQGAHAGQRIVVLFNAERYFWITGFQAEAGDDYVDRQYGFWAHQPR